MRKLKKTKAWGFRQKGTNLLGAMAFWSKTEASKWTSSYDVVVPVWITPRKEIKNGKRKNRTG